MSNKKQRITNKRHTKMTYNQRLAHNEVVNVRLNSLQKTGTTKNGAKSFAERAVELNEFDNITDALFWWCAENPYFSQRELMDFLLSEFKEVFATCKTKYPQTFYKSIEKVDDWYEAMRASCVPSNKAILRLLYKEAVDSKMSHRDAMNLVRLMHDVESWKREEKIDNTVSEETASTLDEINQGLKELGGDNNG